MGIRQLVLVVTMALLTADVLICASYLYLLVHPTRALATKSILAHSLTTAFDPNVCV